MYHRKQENKKTSRVDTILQTFRYVKPPNEPPIVGRLGVATRLATPYTIPYHGDPDHAAPAALAARFAVYVKVAHCTADRDATYIPLQ